MPNTAIQAALTSLIPSLPASNKPFPPHLLSQAESLLALSRQRASNLKAEEEIARAHACAEIACTKLRAQLRLPAIKNGAGAPCKPKVYAKLVKFLEGALGDVHVGALTPGGRKRDGDGNLKATSVSGSGRKSTFGTPRRRDRVVDETPSKKRVIDRDMGTTFAGTIKGRRRAQVNGDGDIGIDDKAPQFVMPSIRKLCKTFTTPSLAPHVYTGTSVVINLSGMWSLETDEDEKLKTDILSLITALYLMVLTRMQEGEMTTEVYTEVSSKSAEVLGYGEDAIEKVEEWINKLNEEGWCAGEEWWESVPESVLVFDSEINIVDGDKLVSDEEDVVIRKGAGKDATNRKKLDLDISDPEGVLLPGLGTMLHSGIDWTSEDMCFDYKEWHTSIVKRLSTSTKFSGRRSTAIATS